MQFLRNLRQLKLRNTPGDVSLWAWGIHTAECVNCNVTETCKCDIFNISSMLYNTHRMVRCVEDYINKLSLFRNALISHWTKSQGVQVSGIWGLYSCHVACKSNIWCQGAWAANCHGYCLKVLVLPIQIPQRQAACSNAMRYDLNNVPRFRYSLSIIP